jgi:hypothetical protein
MSGVGGRTGSIIDSLDQTHLVKADLSTCSIRVPEWIAVHVIDHRQDTAPEPPRAATSAIISAEYPFSGFCKNLSV